MTASVAGRASWPRSAAQFAALMLAVLLPALLDLGYKPRDAEFLLIALGAVTAGALLALAVFRVPLLDRLVFVLLATLILDINFLTSLALVWLAALVLVAISFTRFGSELRNVGALFATAFVVLAALSAPRFLLEPALPATRESGARPPGTAKPLLLHIVLDEQASPLIASPEIRDTGAPKRIVGSYLQRGFHVQSSVRATSGATQRSLARVFGPGDTRAGKRNYSGPDGDFTNRVLENELLGALQQRKYDVSVVQSSFLELCVRSVATCHTYPRVNHGHAMRRFDSALATRLRLAGALLHVELLDMGEVRGAHLYRALGEVAMKHDLIPIRTKRHYWTRPAAVLEVLDIMEEHVPDMQPGEAWIVHLLLPHFPYVLDSRCGLRPYAAWSLPPWTSDRATSAIPAARLEVDYWQQVECVHSRVLALVDRLDNALGREDVRILIHGDHGARLHDKQPAPGIDALLAAEPNGALDTLVLVRAPGLVPGVDDSRQSLPESVQRSYAAMLQ